MPTHDAGAELSMALKNLRREFPGEGAKDGVLILEDRQRPPAGGAAGPYSGQLQALPRDLVPHVGQTVAIGALRNRSLAWRHVPFHLGLVLSVAGPRRADDEAPVLGVLRKTQGEHRIQGTEPHTVAGKLLVARHWDIPPKKTRRGFQSGDDPVQILVLHGPHPRHRPVSGPVMMPRRPKAASAASPGGVSSVRTVVQPALRQLRLTTRRLSDG